MKTMSTPTRALWGQNTAKNGPDRASWVVAHACRYLRRRGSVYFPRLLLALRRSIGPSPRQTWRGGLPAQSMASAPIPTLTTRRHVAALKGRREWTVARRLVAAPGPSIKAPEFGARRPTLTHPKDRSR